MKGSLKKVRPGVWRLTVDVAPRGADGKRNQRRFTIHAGGEREAQREANKILVDACAGNIAAASNETVEAYLVRWLEKRKADGLSPKSLETWGDFLRAYVAPQLGKVALEKLTAKQVDGFYTHLLTSGRRTSEGGLSPRTVLHVHRFLFSAMKAAVVLEIIPKNPCEYIGPKGVKLKERRHVKKFGVDALRKLYAAVEGTWLYVPVILATGMGLRRGECLGLTWDRVDFKTGILGVENTVQQLRGPDGGLFEKKPKGETERDNTMPEFVAEVLRKHKGEQAQQRLILADAWTDRGFVVTDGFGGPRSPNSLSHTFATVMGRLAKAEGIPDLTFHDLRHVAATAQLLMGVPITTVSRRMGHSSIAITADLYGHVLRDMDEDAAARADEYFRRAFGS